jgi:molybdenum cofactor synthesis domain-containing protein
MTDERELRARVITASTRAANGVYADTAGPVAVAALRSWGFTVDDPVVVPDGPDVEVALRAAIAEHVDCIITSGGTGLAATDRTPEATSAVIERTVPGLAEMLRATAWDRVPAAALSRGIAGVVGATLIVNLPGSRTGVQDAMAVLANVIPHAVSQLGGGDHEPEHDEPEHHGG